jgi:hypothetical protein
MKYYRLDIEAYDNHENNVLKVTKVSEEDLINVIKPIADVLKSHRYNWNNTWNAEITPEILYKDVITDIQIENFNCDFCPSPRSESQIHTINKISITPWSEPEFLYNRY